MPYKNVPEELWGKMDDCVEKVQAKGQDKEGAVAICYASIVEGQSAALNFILDVDVLSAEPVDEMSTEGEIYLIDEYVTVAPGQPYRLFPFGTIVKNGKRREITPEMAGKFRLPHFKPPVKLGSHEEVTPAGGHIIGLEVRPDGLYALPELNEQGQAALNRGDYRYHSPEVIWEGGGLEDPSTGETIPGPLIVGDALLHTPHLGEGAALYSIEPLMAKEEVKEMTEEVIEVKKSLWDQFKALFIKHEDKGGDPILEAPAETPVNQEPEKMEALQAEKEKLEAEAKQANDKAEEMQAEVEKMKAETMRKERVDSFAVQLKETKAEQNAEMLASMTDDQAAWVITQLRALSVQVQANDQLTKEIGTPAEIETNPATRLDNEIRAVMAEKKIGYPEAFETVRKTKPELLKI
jgi:hypothetical protein